MNLDCPDLPDDEPLKAAHGCECGLCRQLRQDIADAALIEQAERTITPFDPAPKL